MYILGKACYKTPDSHQYDVSCFIVSNMLGMTLNL